MLSACASVQPTTPQTPPIPQAPVESGGEPKIDLDALSRSLGLQGPAQDLGYREKSFNTCKVGYGFSMSHDCRNMVLAVIRFQLQCRDSDGTVSDVNYQLNPVAGKAARWNLGRIQGVTITDGDGFAEIQALAAASPRADRLRITVHGNFLIIRAEDARRIVAPKSFCEH